MKRVLLVAPLDGIVGGILKWTGHIYEYYNTHGGADCNLEFLSTGRKKFVNPNTSFFKRACLGLTEYPTILIKYRKKIAHKKFDVIHLTSSGGLSFLKDPLFLLLAKIKGAKSVVHLHFGRVPQLVKEKNWEYRMMRCTFRLADRIIAIDNSTREALVQDGFSNVEMLPNPLAPKVRDIINKHGAVTRVPRTILFTGHVLRTKGVFELLEACSKIENVNVRILGRITDEVRQQIASLYPEEQQWFQLLGEKPYEDVLREMMACDLFVLPTYTEGFPNVILEAMATGCAIVSTPVGAIPEMLEPEKDGSRVASLVPVQDVETLRSAIIELLDNEKLKGSMRKIVVSRVEERYNLPSIWNQMIKIWESL